MSLSSIVARIVPSGAFPPLVIDCGSAYTKVAYKGRLIWEQPTLVARDQQSNTYVSTGIVAVRQLALDAQRHLRAVYPIQNRMVAHMEGLEWYITQLLKQITWVDGSSISIFAPLLFIVPMGQSRSNSKQWLKFTTTLGRKISFLTEELVVSKLQTEIFLPTWIIDFGYSHTTCAFYDEDGYVASNSFPWGLNRLIRALERSVTQRNIHLSSEQIEQVLQQLVFVPTIDGSIKKRKIGLSAKQIGNGSSVRLILNQEDVESSVVEIVVEWLWLVKQQMVQLSQTIEKDLTKTKFYCFGGGSLLTGLTQNIERTLSMQMQANLVGVTSLPPLVTKNYVHTK